PEILQGQRIAIILSDSCDSEGHAALAAAASVLRAGEFKVIVMLMTETLGPPPSSIAGIPADGMVLRLSVGHRLMAWAHLLLEIPELLSSAQMLFWDGTEFEVIDGPNLATTLDRVKASSADVISATAHRGGDKIVLDSYFLAVRGGGAHATRLVDYCADLRAFPAADSL